jgi:hypothetical protein
MLLVGPVCYNILHIRVHYYQLTSHTRQRRFALLQLYFETYLDELLLHTFSITFSVDLMHADQY